MNVADAIALDGSHPIGSDRIEFAGVIALYGVAGALQFSIAVAQILLTIAIACWMVLVIIRRERIEVPHCFLPLFLYAGLTLVSAALSIDPRASLIDCKQLVLLLIVPLTCRLATGTRGSTLMTVLLSCAAVAAAVGLVQYGILEYDNLQRRVQGTLGHYMTYSGVLMLVIAVALARVLFGERDRTWAALVMPALAVAVAVSLSRNAWVGTFAAAALLLALKNVRLVAVLPIVAAIFVVIAPAELTSRFTSMFSLHDPTNRDRLAMLREGRHMITVHPLTGVGPNMVLRVYPEYRDPAAVEMLNPHLHNVPVQIAAERGLPALSAWVWFVVWLMADLGGRFRTAGNRFLVAAALAAVTAMLAGGLFEYNFGDSEFLMLFLIVITLPFAAGSDRLAEGNRSAPDDPAFNNRSGRTATP
jgi:putative inorganic carbon (HCO3(-)) transporter